MTPPSLATADPVPGREPAERPLSRLAFIITELEVGGAERCLTQLVLRLDRRRFAPVVYSLGRRPAAGQDELVRQLERAAVPIRFLDAGSVWQALPAGRKLRWLLREQRPELVQTFLFHANVLGSWAARGAGVPHIVWGVRVADPTRWRQWIERRLAHAAERVVCVSESVATFLHKSVGLPASKLCVIPNGIDPRLYPAPQGLPLSSLGLAPNRRAIAVVGRLHAQKGLDWFLDALPPLLQQFSDVDVLLMGQGPQQQRLANLAVRAGIEDRVHFLGWRADVPAILASSTLLVLPSRWEGMPNAVLEAMASGLPVVATRAEGVIELVGESAGNLLVDFGNREQLCASIASILEDPRRAAEAGARNRARILERFTLDEMVRRYETLYASLLGT